MKENRLGGLGRKIRDIRTSKRVSLRDLAKHTGLTRSFISQVERAEASPSIASLEKISKALNMRVSQFFEEEFPRRFSLVRKNRKKKFLSKGLKASCEILVSDILDIAMVPILFNIKAGGEVTKAQLEVYRREKYITVLKGKIELGCAAVGKKKIVLEEGDNLYCKYSFACKEMRNVGKKEAIVLWVVCTPLI